MKQKTLSALVSVSALLTLGHSAAHAFSDLELSWWINDELVDSFSLAGVDLGGGHFNYTGNLIYENPLTPLETVEFTFNLNGKPDANIGTADQVLVSGNLALENLFSSEIDVRLLVELPTTPSSLTTAVAGSVAIGLTTDQDGGTITNAPSGVPVWQARFDGAALGPDTSLFDPLELYNVGIGSVGTSGNFGIPDLIAGPALTSSIGFDINYSLTSGDLASITSVFVATIPGPGGLATLLIAGLVTRSRRRGDRRRRS